MKCPVCLEPLTRAGTSAMEPAVPPKKTIHREAAWLSMLAEMR
jgi:hypothetical protein